MAEQIDITDREDVDVGQGCLWRLGVADHRLGDLGLSVRPDFLKRRGGRPRGWCPSRFPARSGAWY
ncbi:hypothetical protein AB5I41_17150 [Sphingomonas sp. MMS24-JH45]